MSGSYEPDNLEGDYPIDQKAFTDHTHSDSAPGRMDTMIALVNWMSSSCLKGGYLPSSLTLTIACRGPHTTRTQCTPSQLLAASATLPGCYFNRALC